MLGDFLFVAIWAIFSIVRSKGPSQPGRTENSSCIAFMYSLVTAYSCSRVKITSDSFSKSEASFIVLAMVFTNFSIWPLVARSSVSDRPAITRNFSSNHFSEASVSFNDLRFSGSAKCAMRAAYSRLVNAYSLTAGDISKPVRFLCASQYSSPYSAVLVHWPVGVTDLHRCGSARSVTGVGIKIILGAQYDPLLLYDPKWRLFFQKRRKYIEIFPYLPTKWAILETKVRLNNLKRLCRSYSCESDLSTSN